MSVEFIDPLSGQPLVEEGGSLRCGDRVVAAIVASIPRFVGSEDDYATSFGWQWNYWTDIMSDARTTGTFKRDLLLERTHFAEYGMEGKTILECGMGGGDDTEVLLDFPFAEVHSFDLSNSVDRARRYLDDPRLTLSQASIFEIPYPDRSFDFVFCHRVLQHTPDPARALRCICKKVRPGGVLFAHSYKLSWIHAMHYKYKYRWLTRRLRLETVHGLLERFGPRLSRVNHWMSDRGRLLQALAYGFVPFTGIREYGELDERRLLELEKLVTFDALTPRYDRPMTSRAFRGVIESEGFRIEHIHDPRSSPLYCTALKR